MHPIKIACLFAAILTLSACNTNTTNTGRVAVLDIQRVAKETGYEHQISYQLDELRNNLQNQLTGAQAKLNSQLSDKQTEIGKKPSKDQLKELNQMFTVAKTQLQKAQQQAQGIFQKERSHLANQLLDSVRPYAKRVANKRGLDVVVLKNDLLVFDFSPDTDITNEVIAAVINAKANKKIPSSQPENASTEHPTTEKSSGEATESNSGSSTASPPAEQIKK